MLIGILKVPIFKIGLELFDDNKCVLIEKIIIHIIERVKELLLYGALI